jgi:transmembrane sensor
MRDYFEGLGNRAEYVVYETGVGERLPVQLHDGAVLELNTATSVTVRVLRDVKEITLYKGEISLDTATPGTATYRVISGGIAVDTQRASLTVRSDGLDTCTTRVFAGTAVMAPHLSDHRSSAPIAMFTPVHLEMRRAAIFNPRRLSLSSFDEEAAVRLLAWRRGLLMFKDDTLSHAVDEINRYNRTQIRIDDADLARMRIGGTFKATDVDGFVRALGVLETSLQVSSETGVIVLSRARVAKQA